MGDDDNREDGVSRQSKDVADLGWRGGGDERRTAGMSLESGGERL